MPSLTRLLGLAGLLLLLFLAAALVAQHWLQHQHARLQAETITVKRSQFLAAAAITGGFTAAWTPARIDAVGRLIGATVTLENESTVALAAPTNGDVTVAVPLPAVQNPSSRLAILRFRLPAATRLSLMHSRTWIMLLVLALTLILSFTIAGLLIIRRVGGGDSRPPWSSARTEMNSLEQWARTSVAQGNALAQERGNRERMEQDLSLNQRLLNQALEEKIRLGRDLHDGVIQALYAAGLTIEAARTLVERDPAQSDRLLRQCLDNLNGTIREVRQHITGLSPEKLRRMSFAASLEAQLQELRAGREVKLELLVDEDAASALSPAQTTEALQISRESISNGLRHGSATSFTVRLHRSETEVGLMIRDNGSGFKETPSAHRGHGLNNMQARAQQVGAELRIDSEPGDGTRVVMTIPINSCP